MARINKTDVIQKAVNDLSLSSSTDKIPTETLDKVQLTYYLNRQFSNFAIGSTASGTGSLVLTAPAVSTGSETYITGINVGLIKDATNDAASGSISVSIIPDNSNVSTAIMGIPIITLTAQSENITLSLPYPMKIKNNSTITMTGTYSLGVMIRNLRVIGFYTSSN